MDWLRAQFPRLQFGESASSSRSRGGGPGGVRKGQKDSGKEIRPEERLERFEKAWNSCKAILENESLSSVPSMVVSLEANLTTLINILITESMTVPISPDPSFHGEPLILGPCLEYTFRQSIPTNLVRLCLADRPKGSKAAAVRFFARAVSEVDDERFLVHDKVHRPLVRLIRACVTPDRTGEEKGGEGGWMTADPEYEEDLVELMCGVCGKIKALPEVLVIFMTEKKGDNKRKPDHRFGRDSPTDSNDSFSLDGSSATGSTSITRPSKRSPHGGGPEYEFLLFSYLLRFLHREGKTGDFARAGMLFLIELAMTGASSSLTPDASKRKKTSDLFERATEASQEAALSLASFFLQSDFSDVLAAGLGALYGLLPQKLVVRAHDSATVGGEVEDESGNVDFGASMVLGGLGGEEGEDARLKAEEEEDKMRSLGVEISSRPEVKKAVDLWLKLIEFSQDILRKSPSTAAKDVDPFDEEPFTESHLLSNAIATSILDAIRSIFLESVLYTAILECSESDGSAVAVLSYLDAMLAVLEDGGKLTETVLNFLMGEEEEKRKPQDLTPSPQRSERKRTETLLLAGMSPPKILRDEGKTPEEVKKNRRKSSALILVEAAAPAPMMSPGLDGGYFTSIGRFSLRDLLMANIYCKNQPTAVSALRLLCTLLTLHDRESLDLLDIIPDPNATAFPFRKGIEEEEDQASDSGSEVFVYPAADDESEEEEFRYPTDDEDELQHTPMPSRHSFPLQTPSRTDPFAAPPAPSTSALTPIPTITRHVSELTELLSFVSSLDSNESQISSTGFDNYIKDAERAIASEPSFRRGISSSSTKLKVKSPLPTMRPGMQKRRSLLLMRKGSTPLFPRFSVPEEGDDEIMVRHKLDIYSPIVERILESLAQFFAHSPELNLALTKVIASLALCPYRSLSGWLLPEIVEKEKTSLAQLLAESPGKPIVRASDDGDDRSVDFEIADLSRQDSLIATVGAGSHQDNEKIRSRLLFADNHDGTDSWTRKGAIFSMLRDLTRQVEHFRQTIPMFDRYLNERRQGLMFAENLADALDPSDHLVLPTQPQQKLSVSTTPVKASSVLSFLTPEPLARRPSISSLLPSTHQSSTQASAGPASPFVVHYRETGSVSIKPPVVATPKSSKKRTFGGSSGRLSPISSNSPDPSEDGRGLDTPTKRKGAPIKDMSALSSGGRSTPYDSSVGHASVSSSSPNVTLSTILDNVVVLEEAIKELVAIIQVRKSLGIDSLRFI
ncbi:hypothetical protein BT69DRAFT_1280959 [Atractiella rhizophila]|nr:hypothetical protein BT69DRAFT_1280959 [Atractiella rhizophila]